MNSYINPLAVWVGPSPDISPNRDGRDMQWVGPNVNADASWIVLHTTVCRLQAAEDRFRTPNQASAHYLIDVDGTIYQMVDEKDAAWADGNYWYNLNSIAIERVDNGDFDNPRITAAQHYAEVRLIVDIAARYGIPLNRTWVIKHNEVPGSSTACPDGLAVDQLVADAASGTLGPAPVNNPPALPEDLVIGVLVHGTVYDTPDNDRSWMDWAATNDPIHAAYVPNQIAAVGTEVTWGEAKKIGGKWLLHIVPGSWALWDDCVDDSADATTLGHAGQNSPSDFRPVVKAAPEITLSPTPEPQSTGSTNLVVNPAPVPTLVGGHPKEDRMAIEPVPVPEPAPIAEAGVTTSEWKLALGLVAQLLVVGTTTVLAKAGLHLGQDVVSLIVTFEFLAIGVGISYIFGRSIRKAGTTADPMQPPGVGK